MQRLAVTLLGLFTLSSVAQAGGHGGGGGHSSGHSSSSGSHYVAPHVTKNGTYVSGHYQSNPNDTKADNWSTKGNVNPYTGEAGATEPATLTNGGRLTVGESSASSEISRAPGTERPLRSKTSTALPAYHVPKTASAIARKNSAESVERSSRMRSAFMARTPCPSTGRTTGACPGYVVDHVVPLCANGDDLPSNMQWQSLAASKLKDAQERQRCAGR